jgi:hypothetical protein
VIGSNIAMVSPDTANETWSNMPLLATEFLGSTRYRTKYELASVSQARIVVMVLTAGAAGAQICAQYPVDQLVWVNLDGGTGPWAAINAAGVRTSAFVNLAAGAKSDVFLRIVGKDGNGSADPAFGQISIQVK